MSDWRSIRLLYALPPLFLGAYLGLTEKKYYPILIILGSIQYKVNPVVDGKIEKAERADRDVKGPSTPKHQRKGGERLLAPPTMGKKVGPRKSRPSQARTNQQHGQNKARRGRRTKPPYGLD